MSQNTKLAIEHEKKERIPVWLYPSTLEAIDKAMYQANCKSRSEFLENAAQMYAGYISADSAVKYLPAALVSRAFPPPCRRTCRSGCSTACRASGGPS